MKYNTTNVAYYANPSSYIGQNMISGICPFCNQSSGFKISGQKSGDTVPLKCDNCQKNVIWDFSKIIVLPSAKLNSLMGLTGDIDNYYQEALNCIAALSPVLMGKFC